MDFTTEGVGEKEQFGAYTVIPRGVYAMKIARLEDKKTKADKPYISMEFDIIEGEYKGRKLWKEIYLVGSTPEKTDTLKAMFRGMLKDLGLQAPEQRDKITSTEILANFCVDFTVNGYVNVEAWEGVERNKVGKIELVNASKMPF